jgi:hypothetical protein
MKDDKGTSIALILGKPKRPMSSEGEDREDEDFPDVELSEEFKAAAKDVRDFARDPKASDEAFARALWEAIKSCE